MGSTLVLPRPFESRLHGHGLSGSSTQEPTDGGRHGNSAPLWADTPRPRLLSLPAMHAGDFRSNGQVGLLFQPRQGPLLLKFKTAFLAKASNKNLKKLAA